jgi:hypothetical protein
MLAHLAVIAIILSHNFFYNVASCTKGGETYGLSCQIDCREPSLSYLFIRGMAVMKGVWQRAGQSSRNRFRDIDSKWGSNEGSSAVPPEEGVENSRVKPWGSVRSRDSRPVRAE